MTTDEVREAFLQQILDLCLEVDKNNDRTSLEKLELLAFAMLGILDGVQPGIPGFIVVPDPHPLDRAHFERRGENWFPVSQDGIHGDIAGDLHHAFSEMFHRAQGEGT